MSYFKKSILVDNHGHTADVGPGSQLQVAIPHRLAGGTYGAAINTAHWTATTSGAGSAAGVANSIASLVSGTANNGFGMLQSTQVAGFMLSFPNIFRAMMRVPVLVVADNTRRAGAVLHTATPQNGVYFEVSPAGVLSCVCVSGGVAAAVASGSFNGASASYALDTNAHLWEIVYCEMGVHFSIDGVLIHTTMPTTAPLYRISHFPVTLVSMNSAGGTTSGTLECWNACIMRLGPAASVPRMLNIVGAGTFVLSYSPGVLHSVIVNGAGGTSVTVYDNTAAAGTTLATITLAGIATMDYHGGYNTGLTVVSVGAGTDVTIVFE